MDKIINEIIVTTKNFTSKIFCKENVKNVPKVGSQVHTDNPDDPDLDKYYQEQP